MEATVLTLGFDPQKQAFPKAELEDFCLGKEIVKIESQFS